ncbi:MAG: hypothetical protein K8T20_11035 [Planctomycetes bacterium]|nr:hypothetical protein [Planctomycetota bacterium]
MAQLLDGSPFDARAFFKTVDYSALQDGCGPRLRIDPRDVDPAMAPGEQAVKEPTRMIGGIAPLFGGYVVERYGRELNGSWRHYRVFVAPRIYLVEKWD